MTKWFVPNINYYGNFKVNYITQQFNFKNFLIISRPYDNYEKINKNQRKFFLI